MSISVHRSQWIWTPLLGWALLTSGVSGVLAQTGGTQAVDAQPANMQPGTAGATTTVPPLIDPTTGLVVNPDGTTSKGTSAGDTTAGADNATIKPAVTTNPSVTPATTLPSITPQTNAGPAITGPTINRTMGGIALNEVTSLPSYSTTIINAPTGTSIPVTPSISASGGGSPGGDELGITLGSFRLYPQIELNIGADSNVFAQNASQGTTASLYTTIAPTLDLRSDWLNHELHLQAGGIAGFYADAPTQNYRNFTLSAGGRIDILTDFYATWSVAFNQNTEALGTPNVAFAQAPTVVNSIPVALGLYQHFNRLFYELRVSATRYTYFDNSTITESGLPGSSRDRTEYEESLRIGYDITDDLALFVQPVINQRRYLNFVNVAGQERNSDGETMNFGATWKPSAVTSLEGKVGYQTQTYQSLGTTSAVTYGLSGSWNGYAPLTLRPSISRSISETALSNFSSFVSTTYGIDFNYLIHDAWTAVGGISVTTADYAPIAGTGAGPRTDSVYRGQIGLLYALRPEVQIGPILEYTTGTSTDPVNGPVYDREVFSVRLIAKR
jgi:hypothetical protein